ncbi:MAG: phosphonate C-P lyase system protein PhnG [Caldimonas sp.]
MSDTAEPLLTERRRWLSVLARAGRDELEALLAERPDSGAAVMPVRPAEIGMVMVRGRIGGTGAAFNLGEASVVRCAVRVGQELGVGYALGRDRRKAELIALFDALLQEPAHRSDLQRSVIEVLERRQDEQRRAAAHATAASKVEFFTLMRGEA